MKGFRSRKHKIVRKFHKIDQGLFLFGYQRKLLGRFPQKRVLHIPEARNKETGIYRSGANAF